MASRSVGLLATTLAVVCVTILLPSALSQCDCNGHGACGAYQVCECWPNWQGVQCAERVCPFGIAWSDHPTADNTAHAYAECSNAGICDRKSGMCKCMAEFEGDSCSRTKCVKDCNGHGMCIDDPSMPPQSILYDRWQKQKCDCDSGWTGNDCSLRACPKGDDPLTSNYFTHEVQTITIGDGDSTTPITGAFTLAYTDVYGGEWVTRPIKALDAQSTDAEVTNSAMILRRTLLDIPNNILTGVSVSAVKSGHNVVYSITFNGLNAGNQDQLVCGYLGCALSGCHPYYVGIGGGSKPTCAVETVTHGNHDVFECSNRGTCNTNTGLCKCLTGFSGVACEEKRL
jgi:hypothetical protein